jgi:4-amino-4-deoxy-L-arabinose transferase-like glycosyltransferase
MLRPWEWALLVAALALFAAQLLIASPQKSAAFDEQYHLAAGYSYLRTGDFRLATTHPPLMGLLGALALAGRSDIVLPLDHPSWAAGDRFLFSDVFLWEANPDPQGMLVAARIPIMVVGLLLVVGLFLWARQMIGVTAGWVVLALAVFDPNLLGNARVVTTDLGLTCFFLLAIWRLWRWLEQPTIVNLLAAGLCAGLAISAKYTGLFVGPAILLVMLLYRKSHPGDTLSRRLPGLAGMGLVALAVVWALYRFDWGTMRDGPLSLPLPAPFYWQQLYNTFFRIVDLQGARYDFFWGEASNRGWWYYFPVALAVKTPLPLLLLSGVGLVVAVRRSGWRRSSVLWMPPLLFLLLGLSGILTIGYRHILPVVPFLILMAGYTAPFVVDLAQPGVRRLAVAGLVLVLGWHLAGSLRLFPHQEAFFNELAGDWYNWSNLLVDSNLDWGQDLPALRQVMEEEGIEEVNLAYFGKAAPEVYGVRYRPLYGYLRFVEGIELSAYNPYTPEPGWYAISATSLRLGLHQADTIDLYRYFRRRRPDARAGYSIYLYRLVDPPGLLVERRVVTGEPVYRLTPEALGVEPGRRVQVKWAQAADVTVHPLAQGFAPPADGRYQPVSANFGDVLTLLGFQQAAETVPPGQSARLTLYWQVGSTPMPMPAPTRGAPLAAFVHATAPDDPEAKLAQFDGWPVALRGLERGDVIAQPVELDIPPTAAVGDYDLLVGLYSPQSADRLPVLGGVEGADFTHLGQLRIEGE